MINSRPFLDGSSNLDGRLGQANFGVTVKPPLLHKTGNDRDRMQCIIGGQFGQIGASSQFGANIGEPFDHIGDLWKQSSHTHISSKVCEAVGKSHILPSEITRPQYVNYCQKNGLISPTSLPLTEPGHTFKCLVTPQCVGNTREHTLAWKKKMMDRVNSEVIRSFHGASPINAMLSEEATADHSSEEASFFTSQDRSSSPWSIPTSSSVPQHHDHYSIPPPLGEISCYEHIHSDNTSKNVHSGVRDICKSPKEGPDKENLKRKVECKKIQTVLDNAFVKQPAVINNFLSSVNGRVWKNSDGDTFINHKTNKAVSRTWRERPSDLWECDMLKRKSYAVSENNSHEWNSALSDDNEWEQDKSRSPTATGVSQGAVPPARHPESPHSSPGTLDSTWNTGNRQDAPTHYQDIVRYQKSSSGRNLAELQHVDLQHPHKIINGRCVTNQYASRGHGAPYNINGFYESRIGKKYISHRSWGKTSRTYKDKKKNFHNMNTSYQRYSDNLSRKRSSSYCVIPTRYPVSSLQYVSSAKPAQSRGSTGHCDNEVSEKHEARGQECYKPASLSCLASCFPARRPRGSVSDSSQDAPSSSDHTRASTRETSLSEHGSGRRRKLQYPHRSPGSWEPGFRGVTVQMRTKVTSTRTYLIIKAFLRKTCRQHRYSMKSPIAITANSMSSSSDPELESPLPPKDKEPRSSQIGKQCASCGTKKTPLWRDAEDGTALCNACGIRYKKYRIRCVSCWHIPRKDTKTNPHCIRCGEMLRLSIIRNKNWV